MIRQLLAITILFALFLSACGAPTVPSTPTAAPQAVVSVPATFTVIVPASATPVPISPTVPALPSPFPSVAPPTLTVLATRRSSPTVPHPTLTPLPTLTSSSGSQWSVRTLLVGTGQPPRLYALLGLQPAGVPSDTLKLMESTDDGASWSAFPLELPVESPCVRNLNLDYAQANALYVSTCQGLYRWVDGKWKQIWTLDTNTAAIVYGHPQFIWAAVYRNPGGPVVVSKDGGATWANASNGLFHFSGVANLAIDPRNAETLYAIINPKYGGSYLRRGTTNGDWTTMPTPLDNRQIDTGMTIDGQTGALYVSVFKDDHWELWRTSNPAAADVNAVSWEFVHSFPGYSWLTVLASGTTRQGLTLYVRLMDQGGKTEVQRSADGGENWTPFRIKLLE